MVSLSVSPHQLVSRQVRARARAEAVVFTCKTASTFSHVRMFPASRLGSAQIIGWEAIRSPLLPSLAIRRQTGVTTESNSGACGGKRQWSSTGEGRGGGYRSRYLAARYKVRFVSLVPISSLLNPSSNFYIPPNLPSTPPTRAPVKWPAARGTLSAHAHVGSTYCSRRRTHSLCFS